MDIDVLDMRVLICVFFHMCVHFCMNAYLSVCICLYCIYSLSKLKTQQKALDYLTKNTVPGIRKLPWRV